MRERQSREDRSRELAQIRTKLGRAEEFSRLCAGKHLVFGAGNPTAALVLVGEAPGGQEDRQEHPFVGPAGQILNEALEAVGLSRDEVWTTNVVKCRPTMPGVGGRLRNRAPTPEEVEWFLPWLLRELEVIQPRAIVCLGATAGTALLGRALKITRERGTWFDGPTGTPLMLTYHPAYLLRRVASGEGRFAEFVHDLGKAAERSGVIAAGSETAG